MKRMILECALISALIVPYSSVRASELEERIVKTIPSAAIHSVELRNDAGEIRIHTWDKPVIEVTAVKRVRGFDSGKAKKALDRLTFSAEVTGDTLKIEGKKDEGLWRFLSGERGEIDISVQAPGHLNWVSRNGAGNTNAAGLSGTLHFQAGSGSIELERCEGKVSIETGSGNTKLDAVKGTIDVQVGSGEIRGNILEGAMKFKAGSGDVNLGGLTPSTLALTTGSGDIEARIAKTDRLTDLTAKAGSGDIRIKAPKLADVRIDLKTARGEICCDVCEKERCLVSRKHVRSLLGAEKRRIGLATGSGDIELALAP